ncbi:MAG TPA: transglutaminase-like domain-containing protein [Bryobacteraceae bacterium]|nr:transglutaminase-like domain-containing protein [Bryobacteraceae bacterium]
MLFYGTVRELSDFLAGRGRNLDLDEAALHLATVEFPGLDSEPFLEILDSYAAELGNRLRAGQSFIPAANQYLFTEMGFAGNSADYYNPSNSCLNEVLTSRTGIPITLSVVYMEVARRLGQPVFGIGLPGHFIVQYDDGLSGIYLDPFHEGRVLEPSDCYELAGAGPDPSLLARVDKRQIVIRMINNLRGIYFSRGAHRKTVQILNMLLDADPEAAEEYKQRAIAYLHMEQTRAAKTDFERYLELRPEAADRGQIEKQLTALKRWLVGMN